MEFLATPEAANLGLLGLFRPAAALLLGGSKIALAALLRLPSTLGLALGKGLRYAVVLAGAIL